MKVKTIITALILLLLLAAIPVTIYLVKQQQEIRKRAAPATTLELVASKREPVIDEQFTVQVNINTGPNQVIIAEMYVTFDPTKLEVLDFVPGTFFTSPNTTAKSTDNMNGRASLTVFLPTGLTPKSGSGTVASLTFKTKAAGASTIRLTDATLVGAVAEGGKNVLTNSTPVTITGKTSGGGPSSPTPTRAQSASPTPTGGAIQSSPTPTGGAIQSSPTPTGGAASATPSPTPGSGGTSLTLLAVTIPSSGSTVTSKRPTIQGTAQAGSTVTITITGTTTVTGVVTAGSTGSFTHTPSEDLSEGVSSVTLTEQTAYGTTRTATGTFTINSSSVPVTGVVETTITIAAIGIFFLASGALLPLFVR